MNPKNAKNFLSSYAPDGFVPALFLMIFLAFLFPGMGTGGQFFKLELIIDFGISLIFFFYGLKLSPGKFRAGLQNWRLHIAIQTLTFIVFPLLVLPFYPLVSGGKYETLWLAMFFLSVLPSTVSSSVVMVSIARGNIPGAIFNASISGIIGIIATPLWMSIFLEAQNDTFAFSTVFMELLVQILLPVFLGLTLNRYFGQWAEKHKKQLGLFDKTIILLIVYKSFSHSFETGILNRIGLTPLILLFACVIALFFMVIFLSRALAKSLDFSREDRTTAVFCGTKKSLVHGSVMYNVLFANPAAGGIILLPIMIYHAFQLLYISILAGKMRSRKQSNEKTTNSPL